MKRGPLDKLGMVHGVAKSKQMVDSGPAKSETSLCSAAEAVLLGSMQQTVIEDHNVKPVRELSSCNGPDIRRVQSTTPGVDGRHQPRADACWHPAAQEEDL